MASSPAPALQQAPPVKGNARGSGYARAEADWYCESAASVRALLEVERFEGRVWDPACGRGNIPRQLMAAGYHALASDSVDRGGYDCMLVRDFFDMRHPQDNICCNPPYGNTLRFALHALALARRKVALLLPLGWLEGAKRHEALFSAQPPTRIWVYINRQSMPPGALVAASGAEWDAFIDAQTGGSKAYCWLVWEKPAASPTWSTTAPVLGWIKS